MSRRERRFAPDFERAELLLPQRAKLGVLAIGVAESFDLHQRPLPDGVFRVEGSDWQFRVIDGRIFQVVRKDRADLWSPAETLLRRAGGKSEEIDA